MQHAEDLRSAKLTFFAGLVIIALYSLLFGLYDGFGHLESVIFDNRTPNNYRDVQYLPFLSVVPVFIGCFIISYRLLRQYIVSIGWSVWWGYVVSLFVSAVSYCVMGLVTYYYFS